MKCDKCKDKGIISEKLDWLTKQGFVKKLTKKEINDCYCDCKFGRQLMFIQRRIAKDVHKKLAEMNENQK